jgi:hypothetical protein
MQPHIARIEVSPEHIAKVLHLPDGTEIFAAKVERNHSGYVVVLGVEHPDLPVVAEGEEAPLISPVLTYHRESWDFDWNVPQVTYEVTYNDPETVSEVS